MNDTLNTTLQTIADDPMLKICPNWTDRDHYLTSNIGFWIGDVLVFFIAIPGIILNIISIYKLSAEKYLRNIFNFLLINLLIWHSLFLLLVAVDVVFKVVSYAAFKIFSTVLFVLSSVFLTASIYMTVGLSVERYISISHPITYLRCIEKSESRIIWYIKYILPITILSILMSLHHIVVGAIEWNDDAKIAEVVYLNYVKIRGLCLDGIVPYLCLIFCLIMLYIKMKTQEPEQPRQSMERELANILIGIVFVFIVCHFLRLFLYIHKAINLEEQLACFAAGKLGYEMWPPIVDAVSKVMLTINSSYIFVYINNIKIITSKM